MLFRLHKPAALFKPEIALLPSDAAGITVSHTAHALAGSPANICDPIDPISMRLIELKLDGAHFPFCVKAHGYGSIPFFRVTAKAKDAGIVTVKSDGV